MGHYRYLLGLISVSLCLIFNDLAAAEDRVLTSIKGALFAQDPQLHCRRLSVQELATRMKKEEDQVKELESRGLVGIAVEAPLRAKGERYTLYSLNMHFEKKPVGQFVADQEGQLVDTKERTPLRQFTFILGNFMPGEPLHYALVSRDKKTCLAGSVIPNPLEFTWPDGASMALTMNDAEAQVFTLSGQGFLPNEPFLMTSLSSDESIASPLEAEPDGSFTLMLCPGVKGTTGGHAKITLERKTAEEIGVILYPWGDAAQKVVLEKQL